MWAFWTLNPSFRWLLDHKSVSWKFLPPSIFQHTGFSSTLQILHLGFLVVFIRKQYGIYASRRLPSPPSNESAQSKPSSYHIGVLLFTTHFAGIIWSRSLHYSFYIWSVFLCLCLRFDSWVFSCLKVLSYSTAFVSRSRLVVASQNQLGGSYRSGMEYVEAIQRRSTG